MAPSLLSKQANNTSTKSSEAKAKVQSAANSEIRAGFLVVASLATLLVLIFMAGNFHPFTPMQNVAVTFNYINGLEKNAPVHLAGNKIGKVTSITFLNEGEQSKVLVMMSLPANVKLKKDTDVFIDVMGFMGEKFIELSTGTPTAEALPANQALVGTDPVPMMKVVKDGTELLTEFHKTNESMQAVIADIQKIVGSNTDNTDQIFSNLNQASANLKDMTADLKAHPWKLLKKSDSEKKKKRLLLI